MLRRYVAPCLRLLSATSQCTITRALNQSCRSILNLPKWRNADFVAPHEVKCPYDAIVLYNPSNHANNVAVTDLKSVWPDLRIIQVCQEGRLPVVGVADQFIIPKGTWGDIDVFRTHYEQYVIRNRYLRNLNVGFYPVWSALAENGEVARKVAACSGLSWIGARAEAMDGLGKIEYKKFCATHSLPTAPFFTLQFREGVSFDEACEQMTDSWMAQAPGSPMDGLPFFIKSEHGGGGRGTTKAQPTREAVLAAIRKVASETNHVDGIYAEMALDLKGASLYQLEMEVDAGQTVDGGRLVYFNSRNQKMIELGFDDTQIVKFLPKDVFATCIHATNVLATKTGYDGRGTNEVLLVKHQDGRWQVYCSEFNKRIQVEHKALSYLKRYRNGGQLFNTAAEQVMRSCGYRPPDYRKDLMPSGAGAVAHIRFIAPNISRHGEISFPVGVSIEQAVLPRGFSARHVVKTGPLYADTDAQFGAALVSGASWEALQESLVTFCKETVIVGKNVSRDYFRFLQKFFLDPRVKDLTLGCNRTFDVLEQDPQEDGRFPKVVRYLHGSVSRTLVNGYKSEAGIKNRGYPTEAQLEAFLKVRDKIRLMPASSKTPFLSYLDHLDENRYYADLKAHIAEQGGAMVSVFPRDVQQECGSSESQLITFWCRLLTERVGFISGHIGYEMGGAQYQTAEMSKISSSHVMREGILCNLPTFSLTRSHWMNGLEKLSLPEVRYILSAYSEVVRRRFHLPADRSVIPYFPYNFHAGNDPEQDLVTKAMLEEGMTPIPNFSWDPRFTMEQFEGWLNRQFTLWENFAGRRLHHIRIKNAGQQKEWTAANVYGYIQCIRRNYKKRFGNQEDPVIHLHNHNFNGLAPHVAAEVLLQCQADGYRLLVVDTAPPAMTHNANLVVAKSLNLSAESREALHFYNETSHTLWQLTERFRDFPLVRIDPHTTWAGGTGSSDIAAADKVGIARHDIEDAKVLGRAVSGLGAIVTPYSQWSMVVGYTCYKQGLRTLADVTKHVEAGGTLNLPGNILNGLYEWKTLLPRPALVTRLLENHKRQDPTLFTQQRAPSAAADDAPFDPSPIVAKLRKEAPEHTITKQSIARVLHYGNFALSTLRDETVGEDNNWLMRYPELAYQQKCSVGKTFALLGVPVTLEGVEDVEDTPYVVLTFNCEGEWIRVRAVDQSKAKRLQNIVAENRFPIANPTDPNHVALFMPGVVQTVDVAVGHKISAGDILYSINSMKMVTAFKATDQHAGKTVGQIFITPGQEVQPSTEGSPLVMQLK